MADATADDERVLTHDALSRSSLPQPSQTLLAFRSWRIVDGELRSPYEGSTWSSKALTARCRPRNAEALLRDPHVAPSVSCGCGISATTAPDADICGLDASRIIGVVRLWGRVVVQRDALRAEHADVVLLAAYVHWSRRQRVVAAGVADDLGCPLVPLETLRERSLEIPGGHAAELAEEVGALFGSAAAMVDVPGPPKPFVRVG